MERKGLVTYIEQNILPQYKVLDEGHNILHIKYVIDRSIRFAKQADVDIHISYAAGAYHDLGMTVDREKHEIISGQMVRDDWNLLQFFNPKELETIAQAVEDHRASGKEPRSIYGKILSSADRNTDFETCILRAYQFRKDQIPEIGLEAAMEDARQHLLSKYGPDGYARNAIYFDDPDYQRLLDVAGRVLTNQSFWEKWYTSVIRWYVHTLN